jgi:hypothetical protein
MAVGRLSETIVISSLIGFLQIILEFTTLKGIAGISVMLLHIKES